MVKLPDYPCKCGKNIWRARHSYRIVECDPRANGCGAYAPYIWVEEGGE